MRLPRLPRSSADRRALGLRCVFLIAAILPLWGCATTSTGPATVRLGPSADLPFLIDPTIGFTPALTADQRRLASEGLQAVRRGDTVAARRAVEALRPGAADLAMVLASEAALAERDLDAAEAGLKPIVEAMPGYSAARVVLGRAYELRGDLVSAYAEYEASQGQVPIAERQVESLRPRVIEVLGLRIESAVQSGRLQVAEKALKQLQSWAPDDEKTLQAEESVAQASHDPSQELDALRGLTRLHPEDEELLQRQARLELRWGDPTVGFQIFQDLAARHPGDQSLADELAGARYYWRLSMLPARVQELRKLPGLTRAEFAGLIYWLIPSVRSQTGTGRIASDILDSPWRTEIIRVVNLGLMDIDTSQHRFDPDRAVKQKEALIGFLRVLGHLDPPPACLGGARFEGVVDSGSICTASQACRLLPADSSCLPDAPVSGQEVVEYAHQALKLFGGS